MKEDTSQEFVRWFHQATDYKPYPFQMRFACEQALPEFVDVPTGLGKTAMSVLGWLWRRRFHPDAAIRKATSRRLVYCLPMRVLVEQTAGCAKRWIKSLKEKGELAEQIPVHVLMGGEEEEDWDVYPDREQILIGTQDMLLSRALNRGYAATRFRWPMQFGMLNTDCLWVFDEVQLMGAGLATTAQLEAFRRLLPDKKSDHAKNGHGCLSVWMSATLQRDWLKTVDFEPFLKNTPELRFSFEQEIKTPELDAQARQALEDRWKATKPLAKAKAVTGDVKELTKEVLEAHSPGTRTIVIANTVKRARAVFDALSKVSSQPELVLLHSRFRPEDRNRQVDLALRPIQPGEPGTIVVSSQVIEAGVDISATKLFTEVAPWASLVQRFGRCNRYGTDNKQASVYWIGLPGKEADAKGVAAPYDLHDLKNAEKQLVELHDVGLKSLSRISLDLDFEHTHVIRQKDLVDLFDTTPDLAGNDIDIDRFIRDVEDSDVQVFWRDYGATPQGTDGKVPEPAPRREELCPVPIGEFKKFVAEHKRQIWRWNFLDKNWESVNERQIVPGQVYLVHADAGGYFSERGWDPSLKEAVQPIGPSQGTTLETTDATDADPLSQMNRWQTIAEHTADLCRAVDGIAQGLELDGTETGALRHAARWHDRGKAHHVFQNAIDDGQTITRKGQAIGRRERPEQWRGCRFIAKAPDRKKNADGKIVDSGFWRPYDWVPEKGRKHFRHELASALAVLDPQNTLIPEELRNLVAYLVAAHHGKVRLSIRSLPNENRPNGDQRFARGIWDRDELPETDLGAGTVAPKVMLSLEPMELGLCEEPPFAGLPSWAERMIDLRDRLGPFRLAYLEGVLRAADMRASREAVLTAERTQQEGLTGP